MAAQNSEGTISFGGLASGLDHKAIVEAMVDAARTPIKRLDQRHDVLELHQGHYDKVQQLASTLDAAAHALGTTTRATPHQAHSSDEHTVAVVAGSGANAGRLRLEVEQLAAGYLGTSLPMQSGKRALGAGKVVWQEGERQMELDVPAQASLSELAQSFNNQRDGLRATVLFDGSAQRLRLSSPRSGAAHAVHFLRDDTGLGLTDEAQVISQARDAKLVLDGKTEITRGANTIGDLIAGLTLNLRQPGRVEIDVVPDRAQMAERIHSLVDAYNELSQTVGEITHSNQKGVDHTKLTGDTTLRNLVRGLQETLSRPLAQSNTELRSLDAIGLATGRDGLVHVNEAKLNAALQNQHDQVARLFGRDYINDTHGVAELIEAHLRDYISATNGFLGHKRQAIDTEKGQIVRRQMQLEHHVERYEAGLKAKFTDLEQRMSKLKSQNSFMAAQIEADKNARR